MTEYDNTNRGSIWKNEKKNPESDDYKETLPDYTGSLNVAGVEYWVSAWRRKQGAPAKAPALSFSIRPKDEKKFDPTLRAKSSGSLPRDDMNDDIPFIAEFR